MSIQKSLQNFDSALEKINPKLPGEIGITLGGARVTEVLGRGQFVYVRLRSNQNEVIQAFNDKVFPGYNLPVLVQWRNNRYEVIERDTQRYPQWEADNPLLARHGKTHSLNKDGGEIGSDPVWVYPYQMMPALVSPFSVGNAQNLYVNPYPVYDGTVWKYFGNTGTASVIPYRPVSGSVLVLVTIDSSTGNPELFATTGTYISPSITGTVQLTSHLPGFSQHRYIPLSYIRLQSGTSYVNWTEIYDVRQWVSTRATGTSIPIVTSDPVSPADGELWLLRETTGAIADGTPIGLLLALTYTDNAGATAPLQLSVWDDVTSQIIRY